METKVTDTEIGKQPNPAETKIGKQPNPAKDGSNSSNTSESDGSSQDGSLKHARPTAKPAISESGNGVPQSPRPGEGIGLQTFSEPTTETDIPKEIHEHDLESQTAAPIGTVDLDSEDSNDSNDVERDKPKTGIRPFIGAAIIVAITNPLIGAFAQWLEKITRPTAPPESNAQNAIDFTNADPYFLGERTTTTTPDANASNLTKDNETDLNGSRIDGQDATELERTPFDGQDASNLTKSNERRLEASPDDETASVYVNSKNKSELKIYIGDALCGSLRGAVATGVDAVNEFGFAPPCPILLAVMINLNRKLDRLPAGSNTNLKDLFGQLCGAIIGLVGISLVYYSLPTKSDYVGNLIINPLGNTFTNILRRRVAKYLKKPKKPAFIGPIQKQPKKTRQLNEQKKLREEARNQKIDLFFKVGGRFCNRILQLILQASMTGVMASARFLLIFGSANVAKELAAALALEYAKSKNRPGSSNDHVQAQTMESPSIPREAPPTTRDLDGFIIPLAKAKAKAKTAAKKAKAKTPAKKTPAKANKLAL